MSNRKNRYLWDENGVRYQLVKSKGIDRKFFNWLFFPGGPGVDSCYLTSLTDTLDLPGNVWHIDFPNNGDNLIKDKDIQDFDAWSSRYLLPIIKHFSNPVFVGHSFGGMIPLTNPLIEEPLKGLVLISSAPGVWLEASAKKAKEMNLPDLGGFFAAYMNNPSAKFLETNKVMYQYYFTPSKQKEGAELLDEVPANVYGPRWWMPKAQNMKYPAWIPQNLPCLIIGGELDACTPFFMFEEDKRFHGNNILMKKIKGAAHFPWIENKEEVASAFQAFCESL